MPASIDLDSRIPLQPTPHTPKTTKQRADHDGRSHAADGGSAGAASDGEGCLISPGKREQMTISSQSNRDARVKVGWRRMNAETISTESLAQEIYVSRSETQSYR